MNPGDVVQLKSGGPSMTVTAVEGSYASCTWFNEKSQIATGDFLLVTLAKVAEDVPDSLTVG